MGNPVLVVGRYAELIASKGVNIVKTVSTGTKNVTRDAKAYKQLSPIAPHRKQRRFYKFKGVV